MKKLIIKLFFIFMIIFINSVVIAVEFEDVYKKRNIKAYGDEDYPPFEYVENGIIKGFNIDILRAVAKETGLVIDIEGLNWSEIRTDLENQKIEMITGIFYSEERNELIDFSVPYLRVDYVVFVNKESTIKKIEDLKDKHIVVQKGDIMEDYIVEYELTNNYTTTETTIEAMLELEKNKCDAVLIGNFQGKYIVESEKLYNIRSLDEVLIQRAYCFGIKEGDEALKNTLDQGLNIIRINGKYDEIYEKWFAEPFKSARLEEVFKYIVIIGVVILIIFLGYSFWIMLLRKEVGLKTKELEELNMNLESMVERRTKELESTIIKLKEARHQLIQSEKMAVLGDLVAGVTHEINTPLGICLTAMSYYDERLDELEIQFKTGKLTKNYMEHYIEKSYEISILILSNLTRATELVRSFKQISEDQDRDVVEVFSIYKRVLDSYLSIQPKYKKYNHSFEIIGEEEYTIKGHPGYIFQIITNLMVNSFKHGYIEGQKLNLKVEIIDLEDQIQLIYFDDGKGISNDNLKKIFNPFFTTNRENGGTGLGLNIVDNIIRNRMDGALSCTSSLGKGVVFTIKIPKELKNAEVLLL